MSVSFSLERLHDLEPTMEEFRDAVFAGLDRTPKTLPCKFFYDAEGSRLFERICELPEYYPTRTESALLAARARDIATFAGPRAGLVEFGSGAGVKVRTLLRAMTAPCAYVPIDISRECLLHASTSLVRAFPRLRVVPVCADYTDRFELPPLAAAGRLVGFFPGSTVGNFTPAEAEAFLRKTRALLGPGSLMVVGVDMPKDRAILEAAYDDAAGVTAAFNLNLLARINRELRGDFDLRHFAHEARWNAAQSRVEMHLVSQVAHIVRILDRRFTFAAGESIHTENSCKYSIDRFAGLAAAAGYASLAAWTDADNLFSIHVLEAP